MLKQTVNPTGEIKPSRRQLLSPYIAFCYNVKMKKSLKKIIVKHKSNLRRGKDKRKDRITAGSLKGVSVC